MAAQAYDPLRIDLPSVQTTPDTDDDESVRNLFGLSGKFSGITAKITNIYLVADYATTKWSLNHTLNKPQGIIPGDRPYAYLPSGTVIGGGATFKLAEYKVSVPL